MNAESGCPHAEQAVALGLHALEPADEVAMLAHLPTCPVCQDLVRRAQEVVLGLAATAQQHDPPPRLRAGLMEAVAATPQLPPEQREQPWDPSGPEPAGTPVEQAVAAVVDGPHPRSREGAARRRRLLAVAAVVAAALAGSGSVAMEVVNVRADRQSAAAAPPPSQVAQVLAELDRTGARHALLRAANGKPVAVVATLPGERQVMPFDMAPNVAESSVYVLWGLGRGAPVALGTFDVDAPSEQMLPVGSPGQADQFPGYGISIEKSRTPPVAPGLVVASGQVAS